jgi:CBS domain containing-hemolysin-like protein
MGVIIAVVLTSLILSFLCSLCEATLYAVTPAKVESLRVTGSAGHRLWLLRQRIEEAIAGIGTVNTIAQTAGAAWAGALVGEYVGNYWLAPFSAAFTVAILLGAEIVPKSIGVAWASALAIRLAWPIQIMIWLVWPVAKVSTFLIRLITRRAPGQAPSEDEIIVMAELAAQAGAILGDESRWVKNVLRLNSVSVRQLMTPRAVIQAQNANVSVDQAGLQAKTWVHSRVPLTEDGDLDCIIGVVQRRVVFDSLIHGNGTTTLRDLMRPALFATEGISGQEMLGLFIKQRQHLAIVTDSAGKVTGLVTLEDLLEYVLGQQIVGEHDIHPEMERLARERSRFHDRPLAADSAK